MTQIIPKWFKQTEIWLIPEDWEVVELWEICSKVISGWTPKTSNKEFYKNWNILWLNTKEVNFNRIYDTEKKITKLWLEKSSAKLIDKNSVIVAMYWATAWKVCINKVELSTNQACCNLMIDKNKWDYNFIFYYLVNKYEILKGLSTWAAQQNLNTIIIKQLKLPLPPLPQQQKIAQILSSLDDKIELLEKQNKTLENIGQAIFKSWFVDFEGFEGDLVESEMGMIPRGWRVGKIGDLTNKVNSWDWWKEKNEWNYNKIVNCIRWTDTVNLKKWLNGNMPIRYILEKKLNEKKLAKWDIVIEISWWSPTQSTWRCLYISDKLLSRFDNNLICSNFCKTIKLKKWYSLFVFEFLEYFYNSWWFFQYENWTTGIKNLDINNFISKHDLIIPKEDYLIKFNKILIESKNRIQINWKQIQTLSNLRDSLLPRLMNGKVGV